MRIAICAVGKIKERALRSVLDDYLARIRRYARLEEIELKDAGAEQLEERFAKAIDPRGRTVALEVDGESWSSTRLARSRAAGTLRSRSSAATVTLSMTLRPPSGRTI